MTRWLVRTWFRENGELVYSDDGPFDRWAAECVLADIGHDASIPRGLGRVTVERAVLVRAEVHNATEQPASLPVEPRNEEQG